MGGDPDQHLGDMIDTDHIDLHKNLNKFLKDKTEDFGHHIRPQRGNSGANIRRNFSRQERLNAMAEFYQGIGAKYKEAAKDFFNQLPDLQ